VQGLVHESFVPKIAINDESNITTNFPQTRTPPAKNSQVPIVGQEGDEAAWGSNFWVTLVDPQVGHLSPDSETNRSPLLRPKRLFSHVLRPAK
jgi:hypothetical protein